MHGKKNNRIATKSTTLIENTIRPTKVQQNHPYAYITTADGSSDRISGGKFTPPSYHAQSSRLVLRKNCVCCWQAVD